MKNNANWVLINPEEEEENKALELDFLSEPEEQLDKDLSWEIEKPEAS